jgi:hypothetical protein
VLDEHARPFRVRPRPELDRDGALRHYPPTLTADEWAHIGVHYRVFGT